MSVVSSGHDVADGRLHREVDACVRAGLTVEVLGLGKAGDGPAGARVRTWSRRGLAWRIVLAVVLPWLARGRVLLVLDPDAAVGAVAPCRLRRRALVVDVHEDYAALLRDRRWARGATGSAARVLVRVAVVVAAAADLTVVADEHVPPRDGCRRRIVVPNLPTGHVTVAGPTPESDGRLRAAYVGDVRSSRGSDAMVDAVLAAPGWELDVVGPVSGSDGRVLTARLQNPSVAARVRLHGRLPPARAWHAVRGAQVGFALLEDTPAFRDAVPSKVYEYLAAGMAVVATRLPRVVALLEESGGGVHVDDAAEAAAVLRRWADTPAELSAVRARASAWARTALAGASPYTRLAADVAGLASSATTRAAESPSP